MPAPGRVGMGQLVDEDNLRSACEDGVEVHLFEPLTFIFDASTRNDVEAFQKRFRLLSPVRFHDPDYDIVAILLPGARGQQHLISLADPGRGTDEDPDLADAILRLPGRLQ